MKTSINLPMVEGNTLLPDNIEISDNFINIWNTCVIEFGSDPITDAYNHPFFSNNYDPNKPIFTFDRMSILDNIFSFMEITPESLYMATNGISAGINVGEWFMNRCFSIIEEFFTLHESIVYELEEDEVITTKEDEGGTSYFLDNFDNTVDIMFGITEEQAYFISLFVYHFNKYFASRFPNITNYMFMRASDGMSYVLSSVDFIPDINRHGRRIGVIRDIAIDNLYCKIILELSCNIIEMQPM